MELLRDSAGQLLRARTYSATSIHTPKPEDVTRTLCGGKVMLRSEYTCSQYTKVACQEHPDQDGFHQVDLTICAGSNPELCIRCEKSVAKRQS